MIITDAEFQRLKKMLDAHAGKLHSENGAVTASLMLILEVHQEMIYKHVMVGLGFDPEEYPLEQL